MHAQSLAQLDEGAAASIPLNFCAGVRCEHKPVRTSTTEQVTINRNADLDEAYGANTVCSFVYRTPARFAVGTEILFEDGPILLRRGFLIEQQGSALFNSCDTVSTARRFPMPLRSPHRTVDFARGVLAVVAPNAAFQERAPFSLVAGL